MTVPSISTVAYIVSGWYELGAEAISQSQPCMTSYFKGGVESWRVARPGQGSGWGLSLVPQAPRSSEARSISSWPEPGHWFMGQGDYDQTSHEDHPERGTGRQPHKTVMQTQILFKKQTLMYTLWHKYPKQIPKYYYIHTHTHICIYK